MLRLKVKAAPGLGQCLWSRLVTAIRHARARRQPARQPAVLPLPDLRLLPLAVAPNDLTTLDSEPMKFSLLITSNGIRHD